MLGASVVVIVWAHKIRLSRSAILITSLLIIIALVWLFQQPKVSELQTRAEFIQSLRFDNGVTLPEVATVSSSEHRARGLSGLSSLSDKEGMLFLFNSSEQVNGFWMKDMRFAIDIIWLSCEGRVISIDQNVAPSTYPKAYGPVAEAQFVLEVRANFSREKKVQHGDQLYFVTDPKGKTWMGCGQQPDTQNQTAHAIMSTWFPVI